MTIQFHNPQKMIPVPHFEKIDATRLRGIIGKRTCQRLGCVCGADQARSGILHEYIRLHRREYMNMIVESF